jgi:hypothetical protein
MSSVIFALGILAPRPSVARPHATPVAPAKSDVVLPTPAPSEPVLKAQAPATVVEPPRRLPATRVETIPRFFSTTDFSGAWALVSSRYAGRGRGRTGAGEAGEREVKVSIASGAPVNCGIGCTIVQDARTLTISRSVEPVAPPPDIGVVVLNLDGSESTITQSNGGQFAANAKFDGAMLLVTRDIAFSYSVTQTLSIEDDKLKIVTTFSAADAPMTMTYVKR